jgi:hypothetical protein
MNLASILNRNEIEAEIPMASFAYATSSQPSAAALAA